MVVNLTSDKGLKNFNVYIEDKSYVNGYILSQDDVEMFSSMENAPSSDLINALRWYNHIKSFTSEEQKIFASSAVCPLKTATATGADCNKEEGDFDLFASDDEEETAEAARLREERLRAHALTVRKTNCKKPVLIARSNVQLDVKSWDDQTDLKRMKF